LIYRCPKCKLLKNLTHAEWELLLRKEIAREVLDIRMKEFFRSINPQTIDPDNGLEYCGQCNGYAEDGNCLVDIIKQCTIRK